MHIVFLAIDYHQGTSGGGIASYVSTLGRELVGGGHKVTIIAKGPRRRLFEEDGIQVLEWPFGSLHWYWAKLHLPFVLLIRELEWSVAVRGAMRHLLARDRVDLVEACQSGLQLLARLPIPFVLRAHGEAYTFAKFSGQTLTPAVRAYNRLLSRASCKADGWSSPSEFNAREWSGNLEIPADSVEIIPNPIAPAVAEVGATHPAGRGYRQREPRVLYTGRIDRNKGSLVLLEAVARVRRSQPEASFHLAGGRHPSISDRELECAMADQEVARSVILHGHVPWSDLMAMYQTARVFVMPSYFETFGISVLEAMAFGLPIVATRGTALEELVEDEVNGLLVPAGDSEALATAVSRILADPEFGEIMGREGRRRVLSRYSVAGVADRTLEFYERVLSTRSASGSARVGSLDSQGKVSP